MRCEGHSGAIFPALGMWLMRRWRLIIMAAAALVALLVWFGPSFLFWYQMTFTPTDAERDAQLSFGPAPSPYLTLAERIARGDALTPADFNPVARDIDKRFYGGEFRLVVFAWQVGNIPAMDAALTRGANPLAPLRLTDPPPAQNLLYAIQDSDEPKAALAMQSLLRHGLSPNYQYLGSGNSLIYDAALNKHLALAKVLLDAGADPWIESKSFGGNAVSAALDFYNVPFIELLASRDVFKGQPAARIAPLAADLAQMDINGDAASLMAQKMLRIIVDQSNYSLNDPHVRYVLSTGRHDPR